MRPLQTVNMILASGNRFSFTVWREDLAHPHGIGNKFRKLKHNLAEAKRQNIPILSFGGAYSNHLHALALAGQTEGIPVIGIIRGEEPGTYSPTLHFARESGMQLHFVSREAYRQKNEPDFLDTLHGRFGNFYLLPEGGSNTLGLQGCEEWGECLSGTADLYALPAGTGCTAAGIAKTLLRTQPGAEVWAFSALKNGGFLKDEAERMAGIPLPNLRIVTEYSFGGYAKHSPGLLAFIRRMEAEHNLPLEQVYTGKTVYGLSEMAAKGEIPPQKSVCVIHTGGLQGKLR